MKNLFKPVWHRGLFDKTWKRLSIAAVILVALGTVPVAYAARADLAGYWDFDEGSGQVAADSSGHANDRRLGSTSSAETYTPPIVDAGGPYGGNEGSAIALSGASASDEDGDDLTYQWAVPGDVDDPSPVQCTFDDATALNPNLTCNNDGTFTAVLVVSDGTKTVSSLATVTVANVAPALVVEESTLPPSEPVKFDDSIIVTMVYTDPSSVDELTADWDWGDFTTTNHAESTDGITVSDEHTYAQPGVYEFTLTVKDDDGGAASLSQYVVAYDPSVGFVTGGGWIWSPLGAYTADPELEGKASFGFASKYKKGQSTPDGNTQFQFKAGNLNFRSSSYQWLVVAGARAKFKGDGTINGGGNYGFMLTAIDGQINGGDVDKFRIKIWNKGNGDVVYDNQMGSDDNADPTTAIGGGSIVIHSERGK